MKSFRVFLLLIGLWSLLSAERASSAQPRGRFGPPKQAQAPAPVEFLGWDYAKLGYALSPGEDLALIFRNNLERSLETPVVWELTTYEGKLLASGRGALKLEPGGTGSVPIAVPPDLKDGAYFVNYSLGDTSRGGPRRFHFDFRRPTPDATLSLNLVALIENMDAEGWTRTLLGPLAPYANIWNDWPVGDPHVDAVLVIGETMRPDDPRLARLRKYVEQGGKMLLFGKPAACLSEMLPVVLGEDPIWIAKPQRMRALPGGPWQGFQPAEGPSRYGVRIRAKTGAVALGEWEDGTPCVVSRQFGKGQVVYVGSASGQEWQRRPSLEGADELALRLIYGLARGEDAVAAMLARADQLHDLETAARTAVRDRVLANLEVAPPQDFVVVSRNNVGRFGWLVEEGGLVENVGSNGRVTGPGTRSFSFGGTQPVVNVGALQATGAEASYSLVVNGDSFPRAGSVQQNWFSKTVTWRYRNGETVRSTLSLGSPGILWEGEATDVNLAYSSATHWAYASRTGIRIVGRGERIDPADLAEGWLLAFTARAEVRDMPQLFVLTRRPENVALTDGLGLRFGAGGFGALFSSRLGGIRRLAPGETVGWQEKIPEHALAAARRWSRVLLSFPVDCDEIAWIDAETVALADRYRFRTLPSDWGTEPLTLAPLPPVLLLAKAVGAPIQLPEGRMDLECPTNCGPLSAVPGDTTLVRLPIPPRDHRALIPADGRMVLREEIDRRTAGLNLGQTRPPAGRNEGAGNLRADLAPYDRSGSMPFNEAPCIDVYKWWYTFNAILARPLYSAAIRERVDRHFRVRYWETLNFYPHKCFVMQKREPWTGVEYLISFVWPTQTQYGYRNFNDANEASGINSYCFANYARYYGDWATLRANWNHCRRLHEFLPRVNDWACMASGALEYWRVAGLDMVNSEPYGNLAFAYAAANTGHPHDELVGLVLGARSLVAATARLGFQDYLRAITAEGDPWRDFEGFYWFMEDGIQASRRLMGSIGMHDTSKGTSHELSLGYKAWAPQHMRAYQETLEAAGQNSLPDLTQRLFLGWDTGELLERAKSNQARTPMNFNAAKDLYDLGLACIGDIPLFLSDWAPAEYVSGRYDPEASEIQLTFRSHEGEAYQVHLYSQREVREVTVNGQPVEASRSGWTYDPNSGWLAIHLAGADEKRLQIRLGDPVAPLHPYFADDADPREVRDRKGVH